MNFRSFICCALILCAQFTRLQAQERISLAQALDQKLVRIAIQGMGGYQGEALRILVENLSPNVLSLEIPAGQIFASEDTSVQDLMLTQEAMMALRPKERKSRTLWTMCTQSFNMSPKKGERFSLGALASGGLLTLAQKISKKGYQNSTAQSAVWSLANQESVKSIYGSDTSMVRDIARTVSEASGVPMSEFVFVPRTHHITSIRTSLEGLLNKELVGARLDLVKASGERIRTYFENRRLEAGFRQFRVGASHTLGDSAELYLRLSVGDEVVLERSISAGDSVSPLLHLYQKVAINYEVTEDMLTTVGVYDEADQLYFLIKDKHAVKSGYNRGIFIAGCYVPLGKTYSIKVKMGDRIIAEQKLDPNAPEPQLFAKITLRGDFGFELSEELKNAKVAIYTESGELRRLIYEIHHLNVGKKRISYHFQHFDGPAETFYIRLVREDGSIAAEKRISP
ncbi:MAG: hypothetical protein AAFN10_10695 [Bacteroidota bacterium]